MNKAEKIQTLIQLMGGFDDEPKIKPLNNNDSDHGSDTLKEIKFLIENIYLTLEIATKDVLNHSQAAKFLNVSESELYQKASRKDINYTKPGKFNYYKKSDLEEYKLRNPQK